MCGCGDDRTEHEPHCRRSVDAELKALAQLEARVRRQLLLQVVEPGARLVHEGLAVIGSSLGLRCPGGCVPAE
eukprot:130729-Prymnesium_polylepis.2